jgi:dTDP-glucose 4,6-dehydratase
VVEIISEIMGQKIEIQVEQQRMRPEKSEVERLCASNIKAKNILSWSPEYSLRQGLEVTCEWFRNHSKDHSLNGSSYVI